MKLVDTKKDKNQNFLIRDFFYVALLKNIIYLFIYYINGINSYAALPKKNKLYMS